MNLYHFRPRLECLEDRLAPSVDHTIPAVGAEHQAFLDLADAPTYEAVAVQSGAWDDPATWGGEEQVNADGQTEDKYYISWVPPERLDGDPAVPDIPDVWHTTLVDIGRDTLAPFEPVNGGGHVPVTGDDVHIPEGVTVTLDHRDDARLGTVRVGGGLVYDPSVNTRLMAQTILVMPTGSYQVGTDAAPVTAQAETFFTTYTPDLAATDPTLLGGGLISHGSVSIVGAATPTWGAEGTLPSGYTYRSTDDGEPLPQGFTHYDYYPNRNVIFRDEGLNPQDSAHVMFMHSQDVAVKYAKFGEFGNGLGRTRKDIPVVFEATATDSNVPARYGPHFHRTGSAGTPAQVEGVLVVDPTSWGVVNHSSNVDVTDSVVVGAFGSAFQIETAAARGSMVGNLAVDTAGDASRAFDTGQGVNDLGHAGHGFWDQGTGVVTTDNVAVRADHAAYVVWGRDQPEGDTGVKSDPGSDDRVLAEFARNTAIGPAKKGFHFTYLNHPDTRATDLRAAGIVEEGVTVAFATVDLYNPVVYGVGAGYSKGLNYVHGYHAFGDVVGGHVEGFANGLIAPREDVQVVDGTTFASLGADIAITAVRIDGQITFRNLDPAVRFKFDNQPPLSSFHKVKDFGYFLDPTGTDSDEMFHTWAARGFVPFDSGEYAGLTNQETFDLDGLEPQGGLAPLDAVLVGDLTTGYLLAP